MTAAGAREIVLATRSHGKLRELAPLLAAHGFRALTLDDVGVAETRDEDAIEAFETFEENARAKAAWFAARLPGRLVLADDSGLAVDALGGAPGVRSKRWSGAARTGQALDDANNAKLLAALVHARDRTARYVCVAAVRGPHGAWEARGECVGRIVEVPSGAGGFGYDPYFWSDELAMTFGDASREAKERVSHRARAVRAVLESMGA